MEDENDSRMEEQHQAMYAQAISFVRQHRPNFDADFQDLQVRMRRG